MALHYHAKANVHFFKLCFWCNKPLHIHYHYTNNRGMLSLCHWICCWFV